MEEFLYPLLGFVLMTGSLWFILGLISPKTFKMGQWSRKRIALAFIVFFFATGGAGAAVEPDSVKQARLQKEKLENIAQQEKTDKETQARQETLQKQKETEAKETRKKRELKEKTESEKITKEEKKKSEKQVGAAQPTAKVAQPAQQPAPTPAPAPAPPPISSGVVKKSVNDICHSPGTTYYDRTKNFTSYNSIQDCLNSGGRLPER